MKVGSLILFCLVLALPHAETQDTEAGDDIDERQKQAEFQAAKQTALEAVERLKALEAGLAALSAQESESPHLKLLGSMVEEQRTDTEKQLLAVTELSKHQETVDLTGLPEVGWTLKFDGSGLLPSNKSEWEGTAAPRDWVSQYLREVYPQSYEALEWGEYKVLEDGNFDIWHKYRAKNESGDPVTKDFHFICDEEGRILKTYKWIGVTEVPLE